MNTPNRNAPPSDAKAPLSDELLAEIVADCATLAAYEATPRHRRWDYLQKQRDEIRGASERMEIASRDGTIGLLAVELLRLRRVLEAAEKRTSDSPLTAGYGFHGQDFIEGYESAMGDIRSALSLAEPPGAALAESATEEEK